MSFILIALSDYKIFILDMILGVALTFQKKCPLDVRKT